MEDKKTSLLYKIIKFFVLLFYPKMRVEGAENLPDGPAIVVGNHSQTHGPLSGELYFPGKHYIWCAGQMMHLKEVPDYAFTDFWAFKPKSVRWLYRLFSYLIAPLSVCIFNNAHTIPVYHDGRLLGTFRGTLEKLEEGAKVLIFPEYNRRYNNILYDFQDKFIDTARLYYKRTGVELSFVPLYVCPALRTMFLGKPIPFCAANPIQEERQRLCRELMRAISEMAAGLPEHTVVPYRNVPKREYPKNKPLEEYTHEKNPC